MFQGWGLDKGNKEELSFWGCVCVYTYVSEVCVVCVYMSEDRREFV